MDQSVRTRTSPSAHRVSASWRAAFDERRPVGVLVGGGRRSLPRHVGGAAAAAAAAVAVLLGATGQVLPAVGVVLGLGGQRIPVVAAAQHDRITRPEVPDQLPRPVGHGWDLVGLFTAMCVGLGTSVISGSFRVGDDGAAGAPR